MITSLGCKAKAATSARAIGTCVFTIVATMLCAAGTRADVLKATEHQITAGSPGLPGSGWATTPRLGNDGTSDLVVYTLRQLQADGSLGQGGIWYQRLDASGAPSGPATKISGVAAWGPGDSTTDNQLDDVSGDYIVYTKYDSTSSLTGRIVLYQISTGFTYGIGNALVIQEARIFGNNVVWREGGANATQLLLYDLAWLGTAMDPTIIAGPIPPTYEVAIGDRYIAWVELTAGQYDLVAFDVLQSVRIDVTNTPSTQERLPTTNGPWIVWQAQDNGSTSIALKAVNIDANDSRTLIDNGAQNFRPTISGNLVGYETSLNGPRDVYVHRLSTSQGQQDFRVTNGGVDHYLNHLFGDKIAYVDQRNGREDIFVSTLQFVASLPVADAGASRTVHAGKVVTLDGSASSDPGGLVPLTYVWTILSAPASSAATLSDPAVVNPSFTADQIGNYVIQLVVTDSAGAQSNPAMVTVSTSNTAPVADAGPDQVVIPVGTTVQLDGSQSYDADGDVMKFAWNLVTVPTGSKAVLSGAGTAKPTFVADTFGTYKAQLSVADPWIASTPATVMVSFESVKPVADAGASQTVLVGEKVALNGGGSADANLLPLTYQWSFTSVPPRSVAAITNPTAMTANFVPDVPGLYIAQLVVRDVALPSDPSTVQIKVVSDVTYVHANLIDAIALIGSLDRPAFRNWGMRNQLIRSLHDVMEDFEHRHYDEAIDDIGDLTRRLDGCVRSAAPDRDDWITSCPAQTAVYQDLQDAKTGIELLRSGSCR